MQKSAMKKNVIADATIVAATADVMIATAQENLKTIAASKARYTKKEFYEHQKKLNNSQFPYGNTFINKHHFHS